MQGLKASTMEGLRARIAALEQRPLLREQLGEGLVRSDELQLLDLVAAPGGQLHEVFTDEPRNSSAALGFTLGLARSLLTAARPAILYLQLVADTQEVGFPYALGFRRFGLDPEQIVLGRVETIAELLWAVEEAVACRAVAAVIADVAGYHEALDFTVSRRLSLRTATASTTALMLRYGKGREASAARLRWRVMPTLSSEVLFDPLAPGPPRFSVTLEKSRLGASAQRLEGQNFLLDWVDHGFVVVERSRTKRVVVQRPAAASGALSAALGHRLSQAS